MSLRSLNQNGPTGTAIFFLNTHCTQHRRHVREALSLRESWAWASKSVRTK
ncbi:hypothetical protein B0H11DRAFT_2201115 [Mycena galericulata]|nr:hypothetical protein B0H11DRAFT_2201115 [Mycena galericulata]